MGPSVRCHGCGGVMRPADPVRWLERESADAFEGDESTYPRRAYTHLGHEVAGYRIVGRSLVQDLEVEP